MSKGKITKEQKEQIKKIVNDISKDETITDGTKALQEKLKEINLSMTNKHVAIIIYMEVELIKLKEKKGL